MFEVGWTEMLVIAIVMIVVVGPKDLPNMLRTFGRTTAKLRAMASDFQKQFNEALKEAELDDVKKSVDTLRGLNPAAEIRKQLNPFEQAAAEVRSGVDAVMKPKPAVDPATPAAETPQAAEPLKNGATVMPGVNGPETAPAALILPAMTDEAVVTPAAATAAPRNARAKGAAISKAPATKTAAAKAAPAKPAPAAKVAAKPSAAPAKAAPGKAATKPAAAPKAVAKAEPKPAPATKPASKKTAGAAK
ncbi:Sec-independent protein translocase protein TatB [Mesorhizobium sp. C416B]|uniref:Sec-independent protein translocase protein TatB n=1 Tax=unclassified Mesorhizobium TaxID=325217 RepID=UPI0003CE7AB2|nr:MULTISPECIES: Sec-independent protein translocase protein TatB [unclassified Mesorhizobium]ESX50189.1 preprotein translocase subunit TatA [Mesorhizobium sp. LSHC426A00]ESX57618.1 preprotein translocase subunit TatA [Mesorhizobium sp. LSHC424B00]ESX74809.1 preprotein translocase subunit TatA [Mesorhizobium sp. LSHC416B00]ESY08378.1 preprotein translocase subunit TatA [Mesorhizobium sp. LNJC399B00]WJI62983.1 Sec-independent protein translocase protein TatB [Mesorhizobium sp. C416B]